MFAIRPETDADHAAIEHVLTNCFPSDAEAKLVAALRSAQRLSISLVAEQGGQIVGHVAFSPVTLDENPLGLGLAPLAVMAGQRRRGIGEQLVRAGLDRCRQLHCGVVVVLGEPHYYFRFGFRPAHIWGLDDDYAGRDAFQSLELISNAIPAGGGRVHYAPEFAHL